MTLTDEQLKDGARLYEEARNSSIAFMHYDQWMQQFGPALFAMAERAGELERAMLDAMAEHDKSREAKAEYFIDGECCCDACCALQQVLINVRWAERAAERDRAEQREDAKGGGVMTLWCRLFHRKLHFFYDGCRCCYRCDRELFT